MSGKGHNLTSRAADQGGRHKGREGGDVLESRHTKETTAALLPVILGGITHLLRQENNLHAPSLPRDALPALGDLR